jgi:hypothetical protein
MPSEKHSQQYERQREPNGEPDQRAAEDLFGAASVTQGPQQESKKQAYQAVAEIECDAFERKDCRAPMRFDEGVQIIGVLGTSERRVRLSHWLSRGNADSAL